MIDHFRKQWTGLSGANANDDNALAARSGGRVALWAIERSVTVLRSSARAPVKVNPPGCDAITHHETALLQTVAALQNNDRMRADMQARWLVKGDAVQRLLRSLEPLAQATTVRQLSAA